MILNFTLDTSSISKNIYSKLCFAILFLAANSVCATSISAEELPALWEDARKAGPPPVSAFPSLAPIIEKLGPSVVRITARWDAKDGKKVGECSGFIISPQGHIVTNHHLVENVSDISVSFAGSTESVPARVIGSDKKTDLALLKVEVEKKLPAVVLGDSTKVRSGDWIMSIGHPYRLDHSVFIGNVSATGRQLAIASPYQRFIQADISVYPATLGGALFNERGQVIGILSSLFSLERKEHTEAIPSRIAFAIPIDLAKPILDVLYKKGKVTRGWLGVLVQPVSPAVADELSLASSTQGALVADIIKGSPGEKAGLQRGDIIVSYDNKKVVNGNDLPIMVGDTEVGKNVQVEVIRNGQHKQVAVTILEQPVE